MRTFGVIASALVGVVSSAIVLVAVAPSQATSQNPTPNWHITATLAESCSCAVSCPCNFGGKPSHDPCQGNRLVTITKGRVGDVDLSGVSFLFTWELGAWTDVTISDKVTDAQRAALDTVMPLAFGGMRRTQLKITKAPITMEMTDTRVRFSTPDSTVDMEVMQGDGDKPVKILNLPSPLFQDYTQYRSTVHQHTSGDHTFSHSGTNGFTSTWEAGSR
jgi:hypothetical protein